jgi:hypothetical protein
LQEGFVRTRVEAYLHNEAEVEGDIDARYQLDRATYNELRAKKEKDTSKALFRLVQDDAIQNYEILERWEEDLVLEPGDADLYRQIASLARDGYKADVAKLIPKYADAPPSLQLALLTREQRRLTEFWNEELVPKDVNDEMQAILNAMTGNPAHLSRSAAPHANTVRRLFADLRPYLSEQFNASQTSCGGLAAAGKAREIVRIVDLLESLKAGKIDGIAFGKKMRLTQNRRGVLALVTNEPDFLAWSERLESLDRLHERYTNQASRKERLKIDDQFFSAARQFLERLGVGFGKKKNAGNRWVIDSANPLVPDWPFERMRLGLQLLAASLSERSMTPIDRVEEEQRWGGVAVDLTKCRGCVHCDLDTVCAVGRPVQFQWDDVEPSQVECDKFVAAPVSLRRLREAYEHPRNSESSGATEGA